jgi:WD40 repeat protein
MSELARAPGVSPLPKKARRSRETLRGKVANWLWGYDYFISYHWKSGGSYAVALAQRLRDRKYDVFLDRSEYAMGENWEEGGRRALRNTKRLVLVATREALTESKPVAHEVEVFSSRGRLVIPIFFVRIEETVPESIAGLDRLANPVLVHIPEALLYIRESPDRLARGPTDEVIKQLTQTLGLTRRRDIRVGAVGIVIAVLAAFCLFATVSWVQALRAQCLEKKERIAEQDQKEKAELRAKIAGVQQLSIRSQVAAEHGDRAQALLLAATAVRQADPQGPVPAAFVPEAEAALRDALKLMTGRALPGKFGGVSPDGRHLVTYVQTGAAGGQAISGGTGGTRSTFCVCSTATLDDPMLWHVDATTRDLFVGDGCCAAVLELPDGNREVRVWRFDDPEAMLTFPAPEAVVAFTSASLVVSNPIPDSNSLCEIQIVKLPGSARGAKSAEVRRYSTDRSTGFLRGGHRFLGIVASQETLEVCDLDMPEAPPRVFPLKGLVPYALSADGLRVVCTASGGRHVPPVVLELPAGSDVGPPIRLELAETLDRRRRIQWDDPAFAGGGRYLVLVGSESQTKPAETESNLVLAWDLKPGRLSAPREYHLAEGGTSLIFASSGSWLFVAEESDDDSGHSISGLIDLDRSDAKRGAARSGDPAMPLAQLASPTTITGTAEAGPVIELAISQGAQWLAVGLKNGRIYLRPGPGFLDAAPRAPFPSPGGPPLGPYQGKPLPPTVELTGLTGWVASHRTGLPEMSLHFVGDRWLISTEDDVPVVHVLEVGKPVQEHEPRRIGSLKDDSAGDRWIAWPPRSTTFFGWEGSKTGDEIIMCWDMASASFPATHLSEIRCLPAGFSPTGRWLAATRGSGIDWLFDLRSTKPGEPAITLFDTTKPSDSSPYRFVEFSPDERFVFFSEPIASQWAFWSLADSPGRPRPLTLPGVLEPDKRLVPEMMGFEPGGSFVWAVRKNRTLAIFALGDRVLRPIKSPADRFDVIEISADGDLALLRDNSESIFVFALGRPDRAPRLLDGLDHEVKYVQASRDLSRMVVADGQPDPHVPHEREATSPKASKVSIWDLASEPPRRLTLPAGIGPVFEARISRDGRWLLASGERGNAVRDYKAVPPVERRHPSGSFFSIHGVIPESRDYQLALEDGRLCLMDLAGPATEPLVLATDVTDFRVSPTGDRVVTLGRTGSLDVYRLRAPGRSMSEQLAPLLEEAEAILGRNLTEREWARNLPETPYRKTFARLPGP